MAREVYILSAHGENFKGMRNGEIQFHKNTIISGVNASGKTTWFDLINWVVTNKDSLGNEKFEIRPLDEENQKVHYVDIIGELVFRIIDDNGDRTLALKKSQKEIWRKKRGSQEQEFAGNQNLFEVDGYPTNEAGFKTSIAENIGSERDIQLLMNALYFNSVLDAKDRRKMLISAIPDLSDVELAKEIGGYDLILEELSKAPSTDEILKKFKNERKELQKRQIELPTRIDEVSMRKVEVDAAGIAVRREELKKESEAIKAQIAEAKAAEEKAAEEQQKAASEIRSLRTQLAQMVEDVKSDYVTEKREIEFSLRENDSELRQIDAQIKQEEVYQNHSVGEVKYYSNQVETLKETYKAVRASKWNGKTFCPTCGQILPEAQVEKAKENWQKHQLEELSRIGEDGKKAAANRDAAKAKADEYGVSIAKLIDRRTELVSKKKELEGQMEALVEPEGIEDTDEYKRFEAVIIKREQALKEMYFAPVQDMDALDARKTAIQKELVDLGVAEAQAAQNAEIDERIDALKAEMRDVSAKVLRCEHIIDLVEGFARAKMDRISEKINSLFEGVKFKLFEEQINGGIREICECTYNGVPFGDLNHGHQILAGIKIIEGFQKVKGLKLPVVVDNSECLSSNNIPQMDGQLILLAVSDDPVLTVK